MLIETMTRICRGAQPNRAAAQRALDLPARRWGNENGQREREREKEDRKREFLFSRTAAGKISDCLLKGVSERESEKRKFVGNKLERM